MCIRDRYYSQAVGLYVDVILCGLSSKNFKFHGSLFTNNTFAVISKMSSGNLGEESAVMLITEIVQLDNEKFLINAIDLD